MVVTLLKGSAGALGFRLLETDVRQPQDNLHTVYVSIGVCVLGGGVHHHYDRRQVELRPRRRGLLKAELLQPLGIEHECQMLTREQFRGCLMGSRDFDKCTDSVRRERQDGADAHGPSLSRVHDGSVRGCLAGGGALECR
jgi:hypothetical protein